MESKKSQYDRNNLHDVPSYQKMFDKIRSLKLSKARKWLRPMIYIMLLTGARITEVLFLKKKDIKFLGYDNRELYGEYTFRDVATVQFNLFTEKNRKNKYRIVPVVKNDFFLEPLESVYNYCKEINYDDTYVFHKTRQAVWFAMKDVVGKDYFPHLMRHISVTNDTKAGISPSILKSKFGWTDLRPHSIYSHLNWFDIHGAQETAFGKAQEPAKVIETHVPEEYPGQMAQMTELNKKIEEAAWNNQKIKPREFNSLEEGMKNNLRTGDAINGKIVVVCSAVTEVEECKKTLDGNKFIIVHTKSPIRKKKFYNIIDKNGRWSAKYGKNKKITPKPVSTAGISVV